jgi:CO/xanthine dehydrogenase Mo-binding subunit
MKYVGKATPIADARMKVTGQTMYSDDFYFPNMLHGKILFSPHAHALIKSIDTSEAESLPGVRAVVTYKDSPDVTFNRIMRSIRDELPATEKVFDSVVRYVGDKVAAVAAETEEIAAKAVRLIKVEYEELPAVFDPEEALKADAFKIYPEGNLVQEHIQECGDVDQAMEEADHVFETCVSTPMVHHAAIETHVCTAHWSKDDKLTVWGPQQGVHRAQIMLSKIFNLPFNKVHVHSHTIGGTFGGKDGMILEPVVALLAKKTGQHVRIRLNRTESMVSTYTRHAMKLYIKMGLKNDGTIIAQDMKVYMNVGPYCGGSLNILAAMCAKTFKLYRIPNMRFHGLPAYTNTPVGGPMRGFGSPQVFAAMELLIDQIATKMGIDPVEIRLKNLVHPFDVDPLTKLSLGNCRPIDCLVKGAQEFKWQEKLAEKSSLDDERYAYGVGVATALHGNGVAPVAPDITVMTLMFHEDGSALLSTGQRDHGAGTYTVMRQVVGEILDLDPELITLATSDTENTPYDMGAGASRNTWVGCAGAIKVAEKVRDIMFQLAAEMLEVPMEEIVQEGGLLKSKDGSKSLTKEEIIYYAYSHKKQKIIATVSYNSPGNAGSYIAHFASVRVDKETGEVKVLDCLAAADVGKALNPALLEGQLQGAIQMGMGLALYEELKLDERGRVINANFKKYHMAKAKDMPKMKVIFIEEAEEVGPFGAKSVGESSTNSVAPAIVNAINHALGTEFTHLPVTPDKILKALQK